MAVCPPWPVFENSAGHSLPPHVLLGSLPREVNAGLGPKWAAGYESPRTREYASLKALRREVEHGDPFGISCCATRGVDLDSVWSDGSGPAVVEAASRGHLLALRRLLELGADAMGTNREGLSALMAACNGGRDVIVDELLRQPNAAAMLSMKTKTTLVTAPLLAERRLDRAKKERRAAVEALSSAAAACDADTWLVARREFEGEVAQAEAELQRCQKVMQHIDAVLFEGALQPVRPGTLQTTVGTASVLAGAQLPDERREVCTGSILDGARLREGRPELLAPGDKASANFWDSILEDRGTGALARIEGRPASPFGLKAMLSRPGSPSRSARADSAGRHRSDLQRQSSGTLVGEQALQKIPHSSGVVLASSLLGKVRTRKRVLSTTRKFKEITAPATLVAARALAKK